MRPAQGYKDIIVNMCIQMKTCVCDIYTVYSFDMYQWRYTLKPRSYLVVVMINNMVYHHYHYVGLLANFERGGANWLSS